MAVVSFAQWSRGWRRFRYIPLKEMKRDVVEVQFETETQKEARVTAAAESCRGAAPICSDAAISP